MKNCRSQGKVREHKIVLANALENVDIAYYISIFCLRIRVISVTLCHIGDKLDNILSHGKIRES